MLRSVQGKGLLLSDPQGVYVARRAPTRRNVRHRFAVVGELIHARDGIIDPVTKRISEELCRSVGRLFANRYCTTRERFDLSGALPPGEAP